MICLPAAEVAAVRSQACTRSHTGQATAARLSCIRAQGRSMLPPDPDRAERL
jgi:hypothetical protein